MIPLRAYADFALHIDLGTDLWGSRASHRKLHAGSSSDNRWYRVPQPWEILPL